MSTILVTGAAGFVGDHVLPALVDDGHRVVALVHSAAGGRRLLDRLGPGRRPAVDPRVGDITSPDDLARAFERTDGQPVDAVLHLAAIPRDWDGGASLRLINTEGTRFVVAAAREAGVRRFVHQSALGVEDDPALHYASSKAKAERIVADSGLDWTILKPSLLFGPGDGFFNIIADLVRLSPGVVPVPGRGDSRFQPLWIEDLARVVVRTFADDATVGRTYELGGPRLWTYREITREVLAALGARRVVVPMPVPLIALVAGVAERLRLPFPVATDQLRQLRLDNVGPLDTIEREFGFAPADMAGRLGYLRHRREQQA
jgi:NADH dehydrogenase